MLTKNFYSMLNMMFTARTVDAKKPSGVETSMYYNASAAAFPHAFREMRKFAADPNSEGVSFGTGTTPPTVNDYSLEATISSGLTVATPSVTTVTQTDSYLEATVTFGVLASVETTITEIGYKMVCSVPSGSDAFLVDRTVLDEPITIPAGQSKQITYTIRFNYGDAA